MQKLYTLTLVLTYNSGESIPREYIPSLIRRVVGAHGGCTILAPGSGYWSPDGVALYIDHVQELQCIAPESAHEWFTSLAAEVAADLGQESVLLCSQDVVPSFVAARKAVAAVA